jgi:hypothetical protein
MSIQTIRNIIAFAILIHGLAHGKAFFSLLADASGASRGRTLPVRFLLAPSLSPRIQALSASVFWLLSTLGFIGAAMSFWGVLLPADVWRPLAIAGAIISSLGSILFTGIWPGAPTRKMSNADTVISLVFNAAILVGLLLLQWPPAAYNP